MDSYPQTRFVSITMERAIIVVEVDNIPYCNNPHVEYEVNFAREGAIGHIVEALVQCVMRDAETIREFDKDRNLIKEVNLELRS